jgi:hypothetical protein
VQVTVVSDRDENVELARSEVHFADLSSMKISVWSLF